jgi:hypothetical protein
MDWAGVLPGRGLVSGGLILAGLVVLVVTQLVLERQRREGGMPTVVIRHPWWMRSTIVGLCLGAYLLALAARSSLEDPVRSIVFLGLVAAGGGLLAVALNSFVARLELRNDRLVWITTSGSRECPAEDIATMRLAPARSGISRCSFVRRDGSLAFGRTVPWDQDELMRLAQSLHAPIERTP